MKNDDSVVPSNTVFGQSEGSNNAEFVGLYSRIADLCTRYSFAVDDRETLSLSELFVEDGSFESVGLVVNGRASIREFYESRLGGYGPTFHYWHGLTLDKWTKEFAWGRVSAHAELSIDGATQVVALRYRDVYRLNPSIRFQSRTTQILYSLPACEWASGFADLNRIRWPGTEPRQADFPEGTYAWSDFLRKS